MHVEEGQLAGLPFLALGTGPPLVVLPGKGHVSALAGKRYPADVLAFLEGS